MVGRSKIAEKRRTSFIDVPLLLSTKIFKNNLQTQSLRIYNNSSKWLDLCPLKLLQIGNFEIFILMVLPYYVYGHFKSLLSRKYIWMQCKWPQYDMCRYILQMLLPNAIFLRQFESCMMFAKVWLQFTNMFS